MVSIHLFTTTETPPWILEIQVAQMVRNLPAMQETWVWCFCQEDPPEKEMPTHSNMLAWEIPWMEGPGWAIVHGIAEESDMTEWLKLE